MRLFSLLTVLLAGSLPASEPLTATKLINGTAAPAETPYLLIDQAGTPAVLLGARARSIGASTDGQRIVTWASAATTVQVAPTDNLQRAQAVSVPPGTWYAAVGGSRLATLSVLGERTTLHFYDLASGQKLASHDLPIPARPSLNLSYQRGAVTVFDMATLQLVSVSDSGQVGMLRTLRGPSVERARESAAKAQPTLPSGINGSMVLLSSHLTAADGADLFFLSPSSGKRGTTLVKFDAGGQEIAAHTVLTEDRQSFSIRQPLVLAKDDYVYVTSDSGTIYRFQRPE